MKKQLQEELIALAEKIVQSNQQQQVDLGELKSQAQEIYEKLTILEFTESRLGEFKASEAREAEQKIPSVKEETEQETSSVDEKTAPSQEKDEEGDDYAPDGTEYHDGEAITEPNTEKIKDIVAQMPPESEEIDNMLNHILPRSEQDSQRDNIGGVHYDHLPQFEPVNANTKETDKPKSLNERLKKGIQIGVNDRHAFVKHLFDGSTTDYNRVLSQLNTIKSKEEALDFVQNMVKPDYNNWEGKEFYESRFLELIENKFEQ